MQPSHIPAEEELIPLDAAEVLKAQESVEAARIRREKYEARVQRANHHGKSGNGRKTFYRDYPFIAWDGEATQDTGYSFFASSSGHEICSPHLTTEQCFDLLLEAKSENPQSIFIWFGGRYDWDEITRQSIPMRKLARLKAKGTLWWKGYRLTEIEGKIYSVTKNGTTAKIFEITSWFHGSYVSALRSYSVGCTNCTGLNTCNCRVCQIAADKNRRNEFLWQDMDSISRYCRLELELMPLLMEHIRSIVLKAGFNPKGWYGPSALARQLLTRHKVFDAMATCPPEVNDAACHAFVGGRFEFFRGGIIGRHWTADKNSAYMHAALDLPNLARGKWRRTGHFENNRFAVYEIKWRTDTITHDRLKPNPLARRLPNGNVVYPAAVHTWAWAPEAELIKNAPHGQIIQGWVFDEDNRNDRPFAFVQELYSKRLELQALPGDNPDREAEWAIKRALASIYGQLARSVGWDTKNNTPPPTHQIEWAGYILSKCRAEMYKVAIAAGENLVSIDTDSVTSMAPIDVPQGKELGLWKVEEHESGVYFQNGVYFTRDFGIWSKGKTRGMERKRGTPAVTPELLIEAIRTNQAIKMTPKRRYVTTRMALNGQSEHHGEWLTHPANILVFGGGGKRSHNIVLCGKHCHRDIHVMFPKGVLTPGMSEPYKLPWKHDLDPNPLEIGDIMWIMPPDLDDDDKWIGRLIDAQKRPRQIQDSRLVPA